MKRPNNITISLPQQRLEQLETLSHEGESIGQTAKRLLLEILDNDYQAISEDQLAPLNNRIETLEILTDELKTSIESRFEQTTEEIAAVFEQIEAIAKKQAVNDSQNHSRLPEDLEGLTSPQLATLLGVNRSTVTRWAKKENGCDPSGNWTWRDGFWFKN